LFVIGLTAVLGCAHDHVGTTTTTSAPVSSESAPPERVAPPPWSPAPEPNSSQLPFDLPAEIMLSRDGGR
jgi:hypothetical protein